MQSETIKTESHDTIAEPLWQSDIRALAMLSVFPGGFYYIRWLFVYIAAYQGIYNKNRGFVLGADFINCWTAARLALSQKIMTVYNLVGFHKAQEEIFSTTMPAFTNWAYPPHFFPFFIWLGELPYPFALVSWLSLTFSFYAFALIWQRPEPLGMLLVLVLAPTTFINFDMGQHGFLEAALIIGGLRLLEKRPILAGILFGCLTFKPQIGLLIPIALIASRSYTTIFSAIITVISLILFSLIQYGTGPWISYLTVTMPYMSNILGGDPHLLYIRLMTSLFASLRTIGLSMSISYGVSFLVALVVIRNVINVFKRPISNDWKSAVLLTGTFLISPYMFYYDLPAFSSGIVFTLLAAKQKLKTHYLLFLLIAWIYPLYIKSLNMNFFPVFPFIVMGTLWLQFQLINKSEESFEPQLENAKA